MVLLALVSGCSRLPQIAETPLKAKTLDELQDYLISQKADLEIFRLRGPFAVTVQTNHQLRLSPKERVNADIYLAAPAEKASLVILVHGHDASKEAHAYQARHLASWGIHCITVQLPKAGPWIANGKILGRLVNFIQRQPELIDSRIDVSKIILIGHSFGGVAVSVALADGAPSVGGVLLDPATFGPGVPDYLRRIKTPVMIIAADQTYATTRNLDYFYRFIRSGIGQVSIKDAGHEDAQYPSEDSLTGLGIDLATTEEMQISFMSALTSAALSLSATGKFDYAWASFAEDLKNGKFYAAKKK